MRPLEAQPLSARELWTTWGSRNTPDWPVRQERPDGRMLTVYEQPAMTRLWVETPIALDQVNAELGWRVAFDALIIPVHRGSHPVAFLRPIELGEVEPERLYVEDQLRCDGPGLPERRDTAFRAILTGQREKLILRLNQSLLAVLDSYPPAGALSLEEVARQEAQLLRRLRLSRMRYQELIRLLEVFDEQQEALRRGEELDEHQPVLRLISSAENSMLRELRQRDITSRAQLRRALGLPG